MSALGQKRTCALQNGMSALPPKADIDRHCALPNPSRSVTEPSLRFVSPEIGNNIEDTQRFSAQRTEKY